MTLETWKYRRFRLPMPRVVRRFKKNEKGVTAVEFALVGVPFFTLLFAVIEASLFFLASQLLETAVDNVGRRLRTGQLDNTTTAQQFRDAVCAEAFALFSCNDLKLDLQSRQLFGDLDEPPKPNPDGTYNAPERFEQPGPLRVLQITATYEWPVFTNFSAPLMTSQSGMYILLNATAVTRAEPY